VTAHRALLFARALGQSPQYWLNLPAAYGLKEAEVAMRGQSMGQFDNHKQTVYSSAHDSLVRR
jgi:plasmid maintenance system antidote protein VapI